MTQRTLELSILRYRPEDDNKPWFQTYQVPCEEDWVILDAINYVKDHLDGSLSYRWSCHMAVCGSCGMMINGEPALSCKTFIRDLPKGVVRIEPLANFPIERDLVVVMDDFMEKLKRVKPYVIRTEEKALEEGGASAKSGAAQEVQTVHTLYQLRLLLFRLPSIRPDSGIHRACGSDTRAPLQSGFPGSGTRAEGGCGGRQ